LGTKRDGAVACHCHETGLSGARHPARSRAFTDRAHVIQATAPRVETVIFHIMVTPKAVALEDAGVNVARGTHRFVTPPSRNALLPSSASLADHLQITRRPRALRSARSRHHARQFACAADATSHHQRWSIRIHTDSRDSAPGAIPVAAPGWATLIFGHENVM